MRFDLVDSEFRSLIRNILERVIGLNLKKKYSKIITILEKIAIRIVSSILAIEIYKQLNKSKYFNLSEQAVSYSGIVIFLAFLFIESK